MAPDQSPLKTFTEEQLAAHGWAVIDEQTARRMRPSLFDMRSWGSVRDDIAARNLHEREWIIENARKRGELYEAKLKDYPEPVLVVALSKARLGERMGWLGLSVESIAPWREPVPEPEPTPDEVAAREAEQQALRQAMGLYPGHPDRKAVEDVD